MNWLITFTQRNASVVLLASLLIVALGIWAARNLQQELIPDIALPVVTVITPYPLAAPAEVEAQVTRPLENALGSLQNLEDFTSTSSENVSVLVLNFAFGTDLNQAEARVNAAVNRVRAALPESAREPTVAAVRFGDAPIVNLVAFAPEGESDGLRREVALELVPLIERLPGVSRVDVAGTVTPEVRVTLDLEALRERGLSFEQVTQILQSAPLAFPVGTLNSGEVQLPVKIDRAAGTLAELSGLVVGAVPDEAAIARLAQQAQQQGAAQAEAQVPGSPAARAPRGATGAPASVPTPGVPAVPLRPVLLSEVADVELVTPPAGSLSRYNGEEALGLAVYRTQEANTVLVSARVEEAIEAAGDELAARVVVVQDQAGPIQRSVRSLLTEGAFGALFAVLVVAVFLANFRSTLITALSIPMSLLVALILLYAQGLTLNVLTLGGLTIALGRLIDDAIVVVENIYHKLDLGLPPMRATYEGATEVASPVTSSTIATVAVFLPLAFVGGVAGEFLRPLALAVTLSVLASLLVAFTIVPLLSSLSLRPRPARAAPPRPSLIERAYAPVITWVIHRPGVTLAVALLALVASASLVRSIPTNFIDSGESDAVRVSVTLPTGTRLEVADAVARDLERRVADVEGVESYETTVGTAGGQFAFARGAAGTPITLTVVPAEETELEALTERLDAALRDAPGAITVQQAASGDGGFSDVLRVNLEAPSVEALRVASERVTAALRNVAEVENVRSNLATERPELSIVIDQEAAYAAGVIPFQAVGAVQSALTGRVATTLPGDERLDVRVTYPEGQYDTVEELEALPIDAATGGAVPLGEIAEVREVLSPVSITREGGERVASVEADPAVENIGRANAALREALADVELPQGAAWSLGGVTAQQNEAFSSLGMAIVAAVGLVYLIMVATFRSLLTPLIMLVSIPLVAVGAFPLMYLTGTPLGLSTMFAFLLLTGIVVTNAIVLIDLVEHLLVGGLDARAALIEGGKRRVRPIVMTALATIFALVPLALGLSESAGIVGQPLAITVIGGLTSSTLLTLLVVPALYLLLQGRRQAVVRERRGTPET